MACMISSFSSSSAGTKGLDDGNIVHLITEIVEHGQSGSNVPKTPVQPPQVSINGHTLYFSGAHADYVLTLLDDQNNTVYQTTVYSTNTEVILPSALSGTFELRLATEIYVFVGEITL